MIVNPADSPHLRRLKLRKELLLTAGAQTGCLDCAIALSQGWWPRHHELLKLILAMP